MDAATLIGYIAATLAGGVGVEIAKTVRASWVSRQEARQKRETRPQKIERLLGEWMADAYHARRVAAKCGAAKAELGEPPEFPPK